MTTKEFIILGAKILTAVAAGTAIFIGLGKTLEKNEPKPNQSNGKPQDNSSPGLPANQTNPNNQTQAPAVVTNLRKVQDTCGKIFGVAQSLSTMAENLFRIFSKSNVDPGFNQNMNCSYGCGTPGFTRLSPYVIEAGYNPASTAYYPGNKYAF